MPVARIEADVRAKGNRPCFPQIDMTFRALLNEKNPPFIVLYSHEPKSYSQVFFTDPNFVPDSTIFYDWPRGCPGKHCALGDDCEMIRFPRKGLEGAIVLPINNPAIPHKPKRMCNWDFCDRDFSQNLDECVQSGSATKPPLFCSRCKLVIYCGAEHQKLDWDEHRALCIKV